MAIDFQWHKGQALALNPNLECREWEHGGCTLFAIFDAATNEQLCAERTEFQAWQIVKILLTNKR